MAKEVSPEEKLYVKEEIEKTRKDFKEDLEKASSKTTRTFSMLALILGILTGLGIYGLAGKYIDSVIQEKTNQTAMAKIKEKMDILNKNIGETEDEINKLKTNIENKKIEVDNLPKKIAEILNKADQTFIPQTEAFITKTKSDISEAKKFISEAQKIQSKKIIFNRSGPLPVDGRFQSSGGFVILLVTGSALREDPTGQIIIDVLIDNKKKGSAITYVDKSNIHYFLTAVITIGPMDEGNHTVKLSPGHKTWTNENDLFSVIALELPKFRRK